MAVSDHRPPAREALTRRAFASGEFDDEEPDILRTKLYHVHLSKLAEAGYVEWDPEASVVRRGPAFDRAEPLLGLLVDHEGELPDGSP